MNIEILAYTIGLLIISTIVLALIPKEYEISYIMPLSGCVSITFLINSTLLLYNFDYSVSEYQYAFEIPLIPEYNLVLSFGVDGISMCFLLLTAFIMPIALAYCTTADGDNFKRFAVYVLTVEIFLVLAFCTTNLFFFFVFFEAVLIPMYIIIGVWGGRNRKINAAYYFFLYTLFGSFFLLYGLVYIYSIVESFDYDVISKFTFSYQDQLILFILFFIPFAIKIPMFPCHLWLPEAHVEAPTIGSVILASLLLKLGGYGFLRFTIPLFPSGCSYFQPLVITLALAGVIYASLSALRQSDLKRIIAYSSVAHMNLAVLGLFSFTHQGIDGAIYLMIGHGIVSAGLFLCIGILYDRYHTRALKQYSGLVQSMPLFIIYFFLLTLGNMGFPGTSSFVAEMWIFIGLLAQSPWETIFAGLAIVLSAAFSLFVFARISFGTLKSDKENGWQYADLNRNEFYILITLCMSMLILGLYSEFITNLTYLPILKILAKY